MTIKKLEEFVRKNFYPRWDRARQWRFSFVGRQRLRGARGLCDDKTKSIFLLTKYKNTDQLLALAIHEVCHAVTDKRHGKKFLNRLEKARTHAALIDQKEVANQLSFEINSYKEGKKITARDMYTKIEDVVRDTADINLKFTEIVDFLRFEVAMSRKEFLHRFKRAKEVYMESKADWS